MLKVWLHAFAFLHFFILCFPFSFNNMGLIIVFLFYFLFVSLTDTVSKLGVGRHFKWSIFALLAIRHCATLLHVFSGFVLCTLTNKIVAVVAAVKCAWSDIMKDSWKEEWWQSALGGKVAITSKQDKTCGMNDSSLANGDERNEA